MQRSCRKPLFLLGLLILGGIAPVGCDTTTPSATPQVPNKQGILAAVYPLAEVARRVAGPWGDVQWLVEGAQIPEEVQDGAELRKRAAGARMVVVGGSWDTWAFSDLSKDARTQRVIEPAAMPSAAAFVRATESPSAGDAKAYVWLDPRVMMDIAAAVRDRLGVNDPARVKQFEAGAAEIRAELEALDAEYRAALANGPRKVLVIRPIWSAILDRYGVEQIAPVAGSETRLGESDYKTLSAAARQHGLKTVYVDVSTPAPVKQQIAERTGLRVLTLDSTGTSAPSGNSSYVKMMRYNLGQLVGSGTE